jgi:Reverse transcriptase (RNA-dependent DNA polymerase).
VVDSLLETLNSRGYYAQGYADDVVIVIRGKHLNTISELMRSALSEVEHWCGEVDLNFNPNKTSLILFTNKRNMEGLVAPTLFGKRLSFANEVKYLGVNLDPG